MHLEEKHVEKNDFVIAHERDVLRCMHVHAQPRASADSAGKLHAFLARRDKTTRSVAWG